MHYDYKLAFAEAYYEKLESGGSVEQAELAGTEAVQDHIERLMNLADQMRKEEIE